MALLDYISVEISDALSDCSYMSDSLFGKYWRFLFQWYRDGCKPLEERQLKKLTRATGDELLAIKDHLTETPEGWIQRRLFDSFSKVLDVSKNAKKSANARWAQERRNADAMRAHSDRNAYAVQSDMPGLCDGDAPAMPIGNSKLEIDSPSLKGRDSAVRFAEFQMLAEAFGLAKPEKLTQKRKTALESRLRDHGDDGWRKALKEIEESRFLRGENARGWRLDFDFLVKAENFQKVIEGKYNDRHRKGGNPSDDDFKLAAARATADRRK